MRHLAEPTRPILRYFGGKWRLAPWIIANLPEHRVYVEPFGGAGSVLLRKPRAYAEVYNDLDGEIVNLFRVVRDNGVELHERLLFTPFSREEYALAYQPTTDPDESARRLIVRAFMGFGGDSATSRYQGGFRSNSNRSGSTPAHDWKNYPDALLGIIERLRGVVVENRDFSEVMTQHDSPTTLHYCDPPYPHETRKRPAAVHGYRHEMTEDDHLAFLIYAQELEGMVAISGYANDLYDGVLAGWTRVDAPALADGGAPRTESLWLSPSLTAARGPINPFELA